MFFEPHKNYSGIIDMYQRLTFLAFLAFLTFSYSLTQNISYSYAAGGYNAEDDDDDDVYDEDDDKKDDDDKLRGVFPRNRLGAVLIQDLSEREGDFIMRLYNPGEVTGCTDISYSRGKGKNLGNTLKVDVRASRLIIRKIQPRYSPYDCELQRHSAFADVRLNRDRLMRSGVKKLSIEIMKQGKYDAIKFETVDMKVTKEKIEIYDGPNIVSMWFYPKNTVALYAKDAPDGLKGVTDSLREFGRSHGLKPLEEVLAGYEQPYSADDYMLFVDEKNYVREKLKTVLDMEMVGTITGKRSIRGPNGLEDEHFDMHVAALLPGDDFDWYKRVRKPMPKTVTKKQGIIGNNDSEKQ